MRKAARLNPNSRANAAREAGREARAVGKRAELRALSAIRALGWRWVKSVRPATPEEDQAGIDIVIEAPEGELYLQVKSSEGSARDWRRKFRVDRIGMVVVRRDASDAEVRALVASALITVHREAISAPTET